MKILLNKIYQYVPLLKTLEWSKVKQAIINLGYEVESEQSANTIEGVVYGKVLSCEKHPNADTLNYCKVESAGQVWDVVCGGKNVATGQLIAHAIPGAKVMGMTLQPKELRGIVSNGMILSIAEIGGINKKFIEDKHNHDIITFDHNIDKTLPIEVNTFLDNKIVDLKILSDRNYAKNYMTLAAELAAYFNTHLDLPKADYQPTIEHEYENHLLNNIIAHYEAKVKLNWHSETHLKAKVALYINEQKPTETLEDIVQYVKLVTGNTIEIKELKNHEAIVSVTNHSHKIERPELAKYSLQLFVFLAMTKSNHIQAASKVVGYENKSIKQLEVSKDYIARTVGHSIDISKSILALEHLKFNVEVKSDSYLFTIPHYRDDIENESNVLEEIIRFYDIKNIPSDKFKSHKHSKEKDLHLKTISKVYDVLTKYGLNEARTYQMVTEKDAKNYNFWHSNDLIKLQENYTIKYNHMQQSLFAGLLEVLTYNYRKEYENEELAFFEAQNIYVNNEANLSVGIIHDNSYMSDSEITNNALKTKELVLKVLDELHVKHYTLEPLQNKNFNPYNSIQIKYDGEVIALIGEMHP